MRRYFLTGFLFLLIAVTFLPIPAISMQNPGIENQIACMKSIKTNKVIPLAYYADVTGEELSGRLEAIKKQFDDCQLAEDEDPLVDEIARDLNGFIKEAKGFRKNAVYNTKAKKYSEHLNNKFSQLIENWQKELEQSEPDQIETGEIQEDDQTEGGTGSESTVVSDAAEGHTGTGPSIPVASKRKRGILFQKDVENYILIFILGLMSSFIGCGIVVYFFFIKPSANKKETMPRIMTIEIEKITRKLAELENQWQQAEAQTYEKFNQRLLETDNSIEHEIGKVISLIKINDKEILNQMAGMIRGNRANSAVEDEEKITGNRLQQEDESEESPFQLRSQGGDGLRQKKAEPDIKREINGYPFPRQWKNEIFSTYEERKSQINAFDTTLTNFNVTNWIQEILKKFNENSDHDEIAFFKEVLPRIKTLKVALTERQYHMFKTIFLDYFLSALGVEEFGREGDLYDFNRHEVVGRIGEGGNDVRKILMPGYKIKHSAKIISKASVKL